MAKEPSLPDSFRHIPSLGAPAVPNQQQPQSPNFMGVPVPPDWYEGLVFHISADLDYYTTFPVVSEPGVVGVAQAFSFGDGNVYEHRCLTFHQTSVRIEMALPPDWWKTVLAKKYVSVKSETNA